MARIGARPGDWKSLPLPEIAARISYARSFTADEMARLKAGLLPEEMEDKWYVVWHDEALWLHRSWTGTCIYRVRFAAKGEGFAVSEVLANRDPTQYHADDAQEPGRLDNVLAFVLGHSRPSI